MHIMLPEANREVLDIQKVFGHVNVQMVKETNFVFNHQIKRFVKKMTSFCSEMIESQSDVNLLF